MRSSRRYSLQQWLERFADDIRFARAEQIEKSLKQISYSKYVRPCDRLSIKVACLCTRAWNTSREKCTMKGDWLMTMNSFFDFYYALHWRWQTSDGLAHIFPAHGKSQKINNNIILWLKSGKSHAKANQSLPTNRSACRRRWRCAGRTCVHAHHSLSVL